MYNLSDLYKISLCNIDKYVRIRESNYVWRLWYFKTKGDYMSMIDKEETFKHIASRNKLRFINDKNKKKTKKKVKSKNTIKIIEKQPEESKNIDFQNIDINKRYNDGIFNNYSNINYHNDYNGLYTNSSTFNIYDCYENVDMNRNKPSDFYSKLTPQEIEKYDIYRKINEESTYGDYQQKDMPYETYYNKNNYMKYYHDDLYKNYDNSYESYNDMRFDKNKKIEDFEKHWYNMKSYENKIYKKSKNDDKKFVFIDEYNRMTQNLDMQNIFESDGEVKRNKLDNCCAHCGTKVASIWRRLGPLRVCNACGLYYKLHKRIRPNKFSKKEIIRRKRLQNDTEIYKI